MKRNREILNLSSLFKINSLENVRFIEIYSVKRKIDILLAPECILYQMICSYTGQNQVWCVVMQQQKILLKLQLKM